VIRQPIFQGFRSLAALGAVGSLTKQKKEEKIRAEQLLYLDVVQAFYFIHAHKKNVENYEKIVKLYQERIEDLEARERIGRSRLSEVVTAKSRMKLQEAELAAARGELANSLHTMEFLTGISIELGDLQDDDLIKEVLEEIDAYLSEVPGRPDVQAAFQSMRAYWQGVIEAQSGLWPHINLENNYYEKREGFQSTIKWDLLFTIDVPLFKGGETVGSIKEAVSRWKKAKLSYSQITREAELEIERAYEDWVALVSTYKAYEEAAGAAQESFNLQKKEYDRNLISNLDVLVALESLFNIKRDAVRSYYEVKESYWRLKVASGDCCE
jgi:outer membrane protein